jgi:hypothetical protein
MPSSVDGVVDHFIQSGEIDEVSFETIHHFVVFGRLPSARLRKIAEKVISLKSRNVFVEEYVIKILTVILNRFSIGAQGEVKNFFLARKIEEFALSQQVTSEHSSSYADVHYALSNYYCTLHSRLRSGKFTDSETPEGGRKTDKGLQKSYESYFRYLALEDERLVKEFPGNRLLPGKDNSEIRKFAADWMRIQKELFERKRQSRILGKQIEILHNARIHEERGVSIEEIFRQLETTIREHFFGICSVEIKNCSESGMDACSECKVDVYCKKNVAVPSVIRRGHDFLSISLGKWYFVVLQFPKSRTANFQAVFEKHSSILLKALRSVIDLEVLKKAHAESTRGQQQFSQFFHKKVAETILAGNSGQDEGARRMVTVSFSDLVNFTAIAERHPPEKVVQILNSFFRRANHVLNLHFATINKYLGDSVMASWGSTSPQENQTTLACESALKLRKIMNAVNLDVIRILGEIGMPLQVRTGISTGVAVV